MPQTEVSGGLASTLPGRYYRDSAIFDLEQDRLFESYWFGFTNQFDVATPGQFRTGQVGKENVIVIRGRDGRLRAFLNVCRHRGTRLCPQDHGQLKNTLRCTYHSWTYALDGKLVGGPHLATMPDFDRDKYRLHQVHLREWLGYVWVCVADEPPSFADTVVRTVTDRLGGPERIHNWSVTDLQVGQRISYDVRANWKIIVENFMECYHCPSIHPEFINVVTEFAKGYAAQHYVGRGMKFGELAEGFTVDGAGGFGKLPGVTEEQDRSYFGITINPQVFINLVPDHVIFHRMFPLTAERTIVECDWLFSPDVVAASTDAADAGAAEHDISHSVELFHRINQQDFAACEGCQVNMASRAYRDGGVLMPAEHHVRTAFLDWFETAIGPH
ncbi:MAG TPA: aromatic ring-hydroxylating dioxygenase subunit alpha [Pseudonocardiaceae bacterium]|nr:aromatic ring-hydroxylating dioxygenase subunit alpha [Pseudonocardiaceae bacterium]